MNKESAGVTLILRETLRATPERLFAAWTDPSELKQWWGPEGVVCSEAEVDLKVGGRYRLANRFPDGKILWIVGRFEVIEAPHRLVYTWSLESEALTPERVTVTFTAQGASTEVTVTHERISSEAARDMHRQGWVGCLQGLAQHVAAG